MDYEMLGTYRLIKKDRLVEKLECEFVALRDLLFRKGIITKEEFLTEIKRVKRQTREVKE